RTGAKQLAETINRHKSTHRIISAPRRTGSLTLLVMDTATVVVTILLAALFTFSASIKLLGVSQSLAIRDHLGVKPLQWRLIGACELAGVAGVLVGLMWAPIGIAAAIGL